MTSRFSEAQRAALREIARLWSARRFVLVGASAIQCQRPMRRTTADIDLSVAASIEEFPAGLDQLAGWTRHPRREHEWTGPGGVRIDVIPAGPELLARGHVDWPSGLPADDERRWSDEVVQAQVSFELASAFVLGHDLGRFAGDADRRVVGDFAATASSNRFSTLTEMAAAAPPGWRNDEDAALARIEALDAGVRGGGL